MHPWFGEKFGNASSINHDYGEEAAFAISEARKQIADLVSASLEEIVFTSGATEANNLAIKGVLWASPAGSHLIVSAAEHRAVLDPAKRLMRQGYNLTILPVDRFGRVDLDELESAIKPETVLVSIIWANNEIGTLSSVEKIARICRQHNVVFHSDAAQAVGRIPVNLKETACDLLSISAHKFYGPKGVGALFVRKKDRRIKLEPLFHGGGHERGFRSGTLPVPLIVGFGQAAEIALRSMSEENRKIAMLRDRLWQGLSQKLNGIHRSGDPLHTLPGNLNVSFEDVNGDALLNSLKGIAVSSGSACSSADPEPSHVLKAIGLPDAMVRASLRFGIGRFNTPDEIDRVIEIVTNSINRLRNTV